MPHVVFLFPGQSSRHRGMIASCLASSARARGLLETASRILGRDLAAELGEDNPGFLASNRSVQLAVFLTTQMHLAELDRKGIRADYSLGLSLGEYSHLVHIGALDFEAALGLVDARGAAYDAGPDGMMVSLFPVAEAAVRATLAEAEAAGLGRVEISNHNSPSQFVISGDRPAVTWAAAQIEENEFASAAVIEDRIAMHSSVFEPVAAVLRPHLERVAWRCPAQPYLPNVTARLLADPARSELIDCLCAHVHKPVLWRQSVETIAALCPDALFIEVGPGRVLSNLMRKSWLSVRKLATDERGPADAATAIAQLAEPAYEC